MDDGLSVDTMLKIDRKKLPLASNSVYRKISSLPGFVDLVHIQPIICEMAEITLFDGTRKPFYVAGTSNNLYLLVSDKLSSFDIRNGLGSYESIPLDRIVNYIPLRKTRKK